METYTCKCGRSKIYGERPVECERCSNCGSGYHNIKNTDDVIEPVPHQLEVKYDVSTGQRYKVCIRCGIRTT